MELYVHDLNGQRFMEGMPGKQLIRSIEDKEGDHEFYQYV